MNVAVDEKRRGALRRHLRCSAAACFVLLISVVLWASPAAAHTGFDSSDPADGAAVDTPTEVITLVFTGDAEPTGSGFEVLEPSGEIRQPTEASTADGRTWVLRFEPPLSGGTVGVRWMVKAPDAHPIEGAFSFTTPEPSPPPADDVGDPVEPGTVAEPAATTEDSVAANSASDGDVADASDTPGLDDQAGVLEDFLDTGSETDGSSRRIGAIGRFITLVGTLVGVGGLVFAASTMRGRRGEVRHVLFWVRRAGVMVVAGAVIEFAAQVAIEEAGEWSALWSPSALGGVAWSTFGIATALRVGGGLALAGGARLDTVPASEAADPAGQTGDHAWRSGADSAGAALGALAIVGAHLFDGHTVTKGNRLLTGATDVIHVAGAAVWAGGVLMMVSVLWRRHREGRDLRARQLAIRFSVVASVALVVVGVAGVVLTVIVLDSPSGLWSTEWGRILIAKTTFVGVAAAAGGYNHKILIPALELAPDDAELAYRFRNVVTGEALALMAVAISTAFLMGAAS